MQLDLHVLGVLFEALKWAAITVGIPSAVWLGKQYERRKSRQERASADVHTRLNQAQDQLATLRAKNAADTATLDYLQRELDAARDDVTRMEADRDAALAREREVSARLERALRLVVFLRALLGRAIAEIRRHDAPAADALAAEVPPPAEL